MELKHQSRRSWLGRGRVLRHRGGALLEAAIVMPVLLYIAFGTVEFGQYFYLRHTLDGAAREGARAGIVSGGTYANVTTAVNNVLTAAHFNTSQFTTVVQDNGTTVASLSSANTGDAITCSVSCTWGTVGNGFILWNWISTSKSVSGSVVMRHE
jgi:Flp pilus assembly protein TadG